VTESSLPILLWDDPGVNRTKFMISGIVTAASHGEFNDPDDPNWNTSGMQLEALWGSNGHLS